MKQGNREKLSVTVDPRICEVVERYAERAKVTKSKVVEEAIRLWERSRQAALAREGYQQMVVATFQSLGRDSTRLKQAYPWLTEAQVRAALGYYTAYPQEIDRRMAVNERWTKEQVGGQYPSLAV